jgi:hypothetical protein
MLLCARAIFVRDFLDTLKYFCRWQKHMHMESKVHFRYLMSLFAQLQDGDLPLYKINFGVMILLPKK